MRLWVIRGVLALVLPAAILSGQDVQENVPPAPQEEMAPSGPPVTVEGEVVNASTGQPLPRALVRVENLGALTDGDGHFRIPGVLSGDQSFTVIKPGFADQLEGDAERGWIGHTVRVGAGMPTLRFALAPHNAITGHVTLSTGAPAEGIGLVLVKQNIVNGHATWTEEQNHQTTPDGAFRFPGLKDGHYLLLTEPESDNGHPLEPACNAQSPAELQGFPSLFFNNVPELAEAAQIAVFGGRTAEVNLTLNVARFHFVQIAMAHAPVGAKWQYSHELQDRTGRTLAYPVHEEQDHTLCAYLPDGSYRLSLAAWTSADPEGSQSLAANLDFSVDGQAARSLRASMTQAAVTPVHVRYEPKPPPPPKPSRADDEDAHENGPGLELSALPVNSMLGNNNRSAIDAEQKSDLLYQLDTAPPGSYWIGASASGHGVCMGDVSSGGQNLARSPWVAGPSGVGTPIEVTLRTDCAKVTVELSAALTAGRLGEGATIHVYAVPAFDTAGDVSEMQIAPLNEHSATLEDLTPGTYHIYAFHSERTLPFRDPVAMAALGGGQEVTVEPAGSQTFVLQEVLP